MFFHMADPRNSEVAEDQDQDWDRTAYFEDRTAVLFSPVLVRSSVLARS